MSDDAAVVATTCGSPPAEEKDRSVGAPLFRIRTVTVFVVLEAEKVVSNASVDGCQNPRDAEILGAAVTVGRHVQAALEMAGFPVQSLRVATNPFPEWLLLPVRQKMRAGVDPQPGGTLSDGGDEENKNNDDNVLSQDQDRIQRRLAALHTVLERHKVDACALGPALLPKHVAACATILQSSPLFSCSIRVSAGDAIMARTAAHCVLQIANIDPLYNFRLAVAAATTRPHIPFFPVAYTASSVADPQASKSRVVGFAVGLENGALLASLLAEQRSLANMHVLRNGLTQAWTPVANAALQATYSIATASLTTSPSDLSPPPIEFFGIDTSANPSLDAGGSVAAALECLEEVPRFGGPGTLAAAAALTAVLQDLPDLPCPRTGYCGLMLPLCEDVRLAQLAASGQLRVSELLTLSCACGVGVDTVPTPGDVTLSDLTGLFLDVAGIGQRWDKSLSCRVFPVPGKRAGEWTTFDFPHVVNTTILPIS